MPSNLSKKFPVDVRMRVASDPRPAISCGGKRPDGSPMSFPYFVIDEYSELRAAYGDKPDRLLVMIPVNNVEDVIIAEWNRWVETKNKKRIKVRVCNRETCTLNMDCDFGGKRYTAGDSAKCICLEHNLPEKQACSPYFSIKLFVCHPETGAILNIMPYRFENHSTNSRDNVLSELEKVGAFTNGNFVGIRFMLFVRMVEQQGKQKKNFPVWGFQPLGSAQSVIEQSERAMLPVTEKIALALTDGRPAMPREDRLLVAPASASATDANDGPAPKGKMMLDQPLGLPLDEPATTEPARPATSVERDKLLHTFEDNRAEVDDARAFTSKVNVALRRNWDGKVESLSDDDLAMINRRIAEQRAKR